MTCVVRVRHWRHGARDAANAKAAVDPSVPGHSRHILSTLREVSDAVAHQSRQAAFGHSTTGNHSPIAVVDDACRNPIACWMHSATMLLNLTMRDTARNPSPAYHLPPAMSIMFMASEARQEQHSAQGWLEKSSRRFFAYGTHFSFGEISLCYFHQSVLCCSAIDVKHSLAHALVCRPLRKELSRCPEAHIARHPYPACG
jgi:hypothetical protein